MAEWFYQAKGQQLGPVVSAELRRLADIGAITPDTLVCRATATGKGADGRWSRAAKVQGLFSPPTTADRLAAKNPTIPPPPLPPSIPPISSDSPRRKRVSLLAVGLVAGGVVTVALLAGILLLHHNGKEIASAPTQQQGGNRQGLQVPPGWEVVSLPKQQVGGEIPPPPDGSGIVPVQPQQPKDAGPSSRKPLDPVALYANCRAAVATISTKDDEGYDAYQGSGFFIAPELVGERYAQHYLTEPSKTDRFQWVYLLTNYHVIRSAATAEVRLDDGRLGSIDDVVMENEDMDLALVVVCYERSRDSKQIAPLGIAVGREPPVGHRVYAIGSPKGLESSLSDGIISGRREVADGVWWLQTTAPISPGSSGGPLLDATGQVVGVVTAHRPGGQNLNFAVPASQILTFLKGRCNSRPLWRGSSITEEESDAYSASHYPHLEDEVRDLTHIVPSDYGKYEYLVHYTIGRAARRRVGDRGWRSKGETIKECNDRNRNDKDYQLAEKSLRKSIELNPEFSPAYDCLTYCLMDEGRFVEALTAADSLVKLVPRCATAYQSRAYFHMQLNRHLEAIADYETAAELGPNDPVTYYGMAGEYWSLGDNEKTVEAYKTAIRLKYFAPTICYHDIGLAYQRMGKFEQALTYFEKAKSLGLECDEQIAECRKRLKYHSAVPEAE